MTTQLTLFAEAPAETRPLLPLADYRRVIVMYSGGKDSLACVLKLLDLGVDKRRLELWHQHVDGQPGSLRFMDWPVTPAYCAATAEALGLRPLRSQWREGGFLAEMLKKDARSRPVGFELEDGTHATAGGQKGKVSTRRRFPQPCANHAVRWCTPGLKIDVAALALNNDPSLRQGPLLVCTGERHLESTARAKLKPHEPHRCDSGRRRVDHWRPVVDFTEAEVWALLKKWRARPHPAYYCGWGRVSCMACIFGDKNQWASLRELDPKTFGRVAAYEREFGCTVKQGQSVGEQADAGASFLHEAPEWARAAALSKHFAVSDFFVPAGEEWPLPAGAYRRCGGPS